MTGEELIGQKRDFVDRLTARQGYAQLARRRAKEKELQHLDILEAAVSALTLFADGIRRTIHARDEDEEYSPEQVRYWCGSSAAWVELTEGSEGTSQRFDAGGSKGDRMTLAAVKADLERGTDLALAPILTWQSVAKIYKRQQRWGYYIDLRGTYAGLVPQEPTSVFAFEDCYQRISRALGWKPEAERQAA